jgi:general secretion pathway protein D
METSIASVQEALERTEREYAQQEDARQRRETERAIQDAQAQTERERERTVASLIANSRQLINETRYTEALGVIDQILVIDPTNDYASGVRPLVEDKSILQEQRRYREDFDRNYARQLNQAEEKKIPYDDILRYPANWPDISELRDQTVAQERGEGAGDVETTKLLETRLPEVKFEAAAFEEVVNFLRDVTGANIFVNWRALEGAGIDRSAPVTARLRDVKFAKALDTILADVGGGTVTLSYTVDEGVITISTSEDLSRNTFTQVYDIRDLIISVPDFEDPPEFNLNQSTGGGRGGGGGGGSLFGGAGGQGEEEITREERIEQITQLIQETVAPDSWRDAGGIVGSVRELSGQLIVTQTPENHRQLMGLLEQLRETRAIQVTIEARFLTVQRNFLEDIGVDVDFVFNQDADLDSKFSPIPVNQETSTFTANPSTGVPGSIGNIDRSLIGTPDNPLGTSAFQLGGTYLDDFAVTFLLRATHASANSTLLTAPRLTLFNGQRAYVVVATQRAYVSDLDPVVGTRAVGFDATIDLVQSGVLLDVQATVSSDRKYVTLTLRPTLARLVELVPFPFQTAAAPTDTTGGGGDGETPPLPGEEPPVIIDPEPGIITATVQQPILEITEVRTTVSVPDGGTLLLGGQTLAGEVEREAGTPILSKIPFLKRLFTNRSMAKDEQVLLILVKPTILIQREAEQKQFPLLSTKVGQ